MIAKTLYDKLWDAHVVRSENDGTALLYIDRHLVHEVTSPQAFEGLRIAGRKPWRVNSVVAVPDHNVPTIDRSAGIEDPVARLQVETLDKNCQEFGLNEFVMSDIRQGIVHGIGPEQGATLPGMTVVCGDSHTSTHGAFGALAFGIGTSEVEHVLATQCLMQNKSLNMLVSVDGDVSPGVTAKDIVLAIIGQLGTAGGTGYAIEFGGDAIRALSIEGRMTVCNMAIEAGARAGMVAVDETTIDYVKGRPYSPTGETLAKAEAYRSTFHREDGAHFAKLVVLNGADNQTPGNRGFFVASHKDNSLRVNSLSRPSGQATERSSSNRSGQSRARRQPLTVDRLQTFWPYRCHGRRYRPPALLRPGKLSRYGGRPRGRKPPRDNRSRRQ